MTREKTLFVLMSHEMTPAQIEDAKNNWNITRFITVPSDRWGQIPAEASSVCPFLAPIFAFLRDHAQAGDLLLVQGDFGATVAMVAFANRLGLTPIYATTRRIVTEKIEGDRIVTTRTFEHVRFRSYETVCENVKE